MGLNPKQAAFVREYLVDMNAAQAAIRAGYSKKTARAIGSRLLTVVDVKRAIDAGLSRVANKAEVTAEEVLRELKRIGMSDMRQAYDAEGRLKKIHDMPEDVARAIGGIETEEMWGPDGGAQLGDTRKVKFWPKVQALELLGKHLKLFTDKVEATGADGGPVQVSININRGKK